MSASLLLEIGTEELPAAYVAKALEVMPSIVSELLAAARIAHGDVRALGTPRRLAVWIAEVADSQDDLDEEVLGPPRAAAFESDGTPKKAAEGFAKKFGKSLADVRLLTTDKGEYAAITRQEKGRPSAEVLGPLLAEACARIPFQKSMRWGKGEHSFGRPVQWLIALHGERVIPFQFAGIDAGRRTRGHRFLAPEWIEIASADSYSEQMRQAHVVVSEDERRASMQKRLAAAAQAMNGELVEDDFLVGENLSMVEEPYVIAGSFDPVFLEIPEEVIVAVMRGHQRYFAVRAEGCLMPRYLAVVNTAKDPATIARGNDRVLRARLSDARFFVEEDRKKPMADRIPKLDAVVFQAKLGSVGEKTRRVGAVAERLAGSAEALAAAALAKADLVSLIVGEFPELQGIMGRWYALEEGIAPSIADAIRDHYLPKSVSDSVPDAPLSAAVAVADRIDTLVGCFGIGLTPTGGADPFALRRAAIGVARIAFDGPIDVALHSTLKHAYELFREQGKELAANDAVLSALDDFFRTRLRVYLSEQQGHPAELVEACLAAWDGESLRDLQARVRALSAFRELPEYSVLAGAFKRAFNIAKDAPSGEPDRALFEHEAERALDASFSKVRAELDASTRSGDYVSALTVSAKELSAPIAGFFDQVMVMHDDPAIRDNRLRLVGGIARTLNRIAHFHLLAGA